MTAKDKRKACALTTGSLGTPTKTVTYTYGDSEWGDLLTAYDGRTIAYDTVGNPLSDGVRQYTWEHGRELAAITKDGTTWTNTYNQDGMRIRRTNGAVTYGYVYNGSQLSQMTVGSNTLNFSYDASGIPMSVSYNGTTYYYATNLQGDVTAILNASGSPVVSYTYNAWGKPLTVTGSLATTLGTHNPLRYRGYVYDTETELYYLQSRYYNPDTGRFLNADAFASTGQGFTGNNMFAYCGNNPVARKDEGGTIWWHLVVGAIVGAATQYVVDVATNVAQGKSGLDVFNPTSSIADYASAAVSGALAATGIGTVGAITANAALGGTTYLANCAIKGEEANIVDLTLATGIGAVAGAIGGKGANGARLIGVSNTAKQVLRTTTSPRKIAMYTAKLVGVKKALLEATTRTFFAGAVSNHLTNLRKKYTRSLF